jgi:hypothetical protein
VERSDANTKEQRIVIISPHFDDGILSCYPLIKAHMDEGGAAEVWTVMGGMPGQASTFSAFAMGLSNHDPDAYVARRIREDADVCRELGLPWVHLPFTDAIYRRLADGTPIYGDLGSLFHQLDLRELPLVNRIHDALLERLKATDTVVIPSARCGHVDHILCRVACEMLPNRLLYYDEFPYFIRDPSHVAPDVLSEWERLIRMYASQMEILFPGDNLSHMLSMHGPEWYPLPDTPPKIPRQIHLIWIGGDPLPPAAYKHYQSWKSIMGDAWQVRLWTDADLTEAHFSREVLDRINEAPHGVQKADILRYQVMSQYGGWYFDVDFEPVQRIEPISRMLCHESLILCNEDENLVGKVSNGFFACTRGNPAVVKIAEQVLTQPLNTGAFDMGHIVSHTGPVLFHACVQGSRHILLPTCLFYPVTFREIIQAHASPVEDHFARHIWHSRYLDDKKRFFGTEDLPVLPSGMIELGRQGAGAMLFCFVRDEPYMLSRWIAYHARIFGMSNLFVIDHGSRPETRRVIAQYMRDGLQSCDAGMHPFTEKGRVLSSVMRKFRHYRFLVPLDCDEFLCLNTEAGMDCTPSRIVDAFRALPEKACLFRLGTFDVCNTPDAEYEDPLTEMRYFHFFPPWETRVFSTQAMSKVFYPGKFFEATDDGNHRGSIHPNNGDIHTGLALVHFHIRGFHHFIAKHEHADTILGITNLDGHLKEDMTCFHWMERQLAIRSGNGRQFFESNICSLQGKEERAFSDALKSL